MTNSKNIICPDDKDIYTTLQSSNINNSVLEELFLNHFTLTSSKGNKEKRALKFSRSILSYQDYQTIKSIFDKEKRRKETTKGILLGTNLNLSEVRDFLEQEKAELIDLNHTSDLKIIPLGNKISIKIDYIVYDFSKNLFSGQDHLSTEIILNFDDSQVFIESTNDKYIDRWQRKIIQVIETNTESTAYQEIEISLFGIQDQEKKLKFYCDLIENISGFTYDTVVDIYVSRKKENRTDDNLDDEQDDDPSEDINRYIKKASFKGSKLLNSDTVLQLLAKHYHIYRIIWQAVHSTNSNEVYQFEVRFNNPEDCTDFAYSVHGKFIDGATKITSVPFEDTKKITSKIFQKARELMDELNKDLGDTNAIPTQTSQTLTNSE
ncbi:hypothetical protein [Acinetobacter sp. V2]|uniref:hypothetical protein n=1 Tax=Acinetobacter sp. V2 TaxID=1051623 RepID=UPI00061EB42C|nr:hypothetical protein [Acinetobacter sp. V2]KKC43510.1 hypothetical protein UC75_12945 [Acinetobacter sp. V2]